MIRIPIQRTVKSSVIFVLSVASLRVVTPDVINSVMGCHNSVAPGQERYCTIMMFWSNCISALLDLIAILVVNLPFAIVFAVVLLDVLFETSSRLLRVSAGLGMAAVCNLIYGTLVLHNDLALWWQGGGRESLGISLCIAGLAMWCCEPVEGKAADAGGGASGSA